MPKLCNVRELKYETQEIKEEGGILGIACVGAKGDESWMSKFYLF